MSSSEQAIRKLALATTSGPVLATRLDEIPKEELKHLPLQFQVAVMIAIQAESDLMELLAAYAGEHVVR